ncbi:hypothetical protein CCS41_00045 [Candidatus Fukatsuia symbiotica]|uniref:Uncharacterized protein n=1 Tax=Candidatus Fukatsuia symbiotica TaxID=1878942 RepID=A0A2Y9CK88_9GAMM|nr:hypothetical protein CCS41_00045 [Candidatus Fukatsuia symbiotica]
MERSIIIKKLVSVIKNNNYYNVNFIYRKFIDTKKKYQLMSQKMSAQQKMALLLGMINSTFYPMF